MHREPAARWVGVVLGALHLVVLVMLLVVALDIIGESLMWSRPGEGGLGDRVWTCGSVEQPRQAIDACNEVLSEQRARLIPVGVAAAVLVAEIAVVLVFRRQRSRSPS